MKFRFFLSIFLVLIVTAVATSLVHFTFFRHERLRLVDQQIQGIASSLISNLSIVEFEDIEEAEEAIADTLGSDRITLVILIRSPTGGLFYKNRNAQILEVMPPLKPQWQTLRVKDHLIRLLNLPVSDEGWILQLGLLLDQGQVHWRTLSFSVFQYIALIIIFMIAATVFLMTLLLKPLKALAAYLAHIAESADDSDGALPLLPTYVARSARRRIGYADEFTELVTSARQLRRKLRDQLRLTHVWTAQMAHELKTPLTIVRNDVERAQAKLAKPDSDLKDAQREIDRLSRFISGFLEWIRVENASAAPGDLHAIKLGVFAAEIIERLEKLNGDRIRLEVVEESTVFAKPELLSQVFTNLIQNALQYSPRTSPVQVRVERERFSVSDQGGGLPPAVLQKIGQPFNWGAQEHETATASTIGGRGTGLGLAWVKTICGKYGWDLKIDSSTTGTTVSVEFESRK